MKAIKALAIALLCSSLVVRAEMNPMVNRVIGCALPVAVCLAAKKCCPVTVKRSPSKVDVSDMTDVKRRVVDAVVGGTALTGYEQFMGLLGEDCPSCSVPEMLKRSAKNTCYVLAADYALDMAAPVLNEVPGLADVCSNRDGAQVSRLAVRAMIAKVLASLNLPH